MERIFKEIEQNKLYHYAEIEGGRKEDTFSIFILSEKWQALKKKEMPKP